MSSSFADTHNVVAILEKSDAAEGFDQIIDFLSKSYIHYAFTMNPSIYISCIKQFWNTASVKRSADVTRLQALVDRKKIVISEVVIREILQLDDAEGVVCLPNEEIFAGLAQMEYEKSSTKLTFYKAFFSSQWKFLIHTLLQRVENLEHDKAAQKLEIIKLKARVKRLERDNKVKSSKLRRLRKVGASRRIESSDDMEDVFNQGRMIDDLDKDERIELVKDADIAETGGRHAAEQAEKQAEIYHLDLDHPSKVLSMQEDDSKVQEVVEVVTTAKLITDVVTAASQDSAASATIFAAKPSIPAAAPTVVAAYIRRRTGVIIRDPEEELSFKTPAETPKLKEKAKDHEEINKDIDWDAAIDHVNQKSKNPHQKEMEEEDQEVIKSINETPVQKAAKRRKLNEEAQEAEDLKKRLEVVDDKDDDVFIEATPLARKGIVKERFSTSKPTNFSDEYLLLTLKTMFEKPDGQDAIWKNQKSVHGLALVKSWKLLTSCGVHIITLSTIQLILLVERRYLLSRFTLEQLVNVTRLQVKEESKMSLELLRSKELDGEEKERGAFVFALESRNRGHLDRFDLKHCKMYLIGVTQKNHGEDIA
nr:hypothetical protein [Tanacetum cinerariifolium]